MVVRRREGCRRAWQTSRWGRPKVARGRYGRSRQVTATAVDSAAWMMEACLALGIFGRIFEKNVAQGNVLHSFACVVFARGYRLGSWWRSMVACSTRG